MKKMSDVLVGAMNVLGQGQRKLQTGNFLGKAKAQSIILPTSSSGSNHARSGGGNMKLRNKCHCGWDPA